MTSYAHEDSYIVSAYFSHVDQAKQLDLEAQLLLSNSRAEIDPMLGFVVPAKFGHLSKQVFQVIKRLQIIGSRCLQQAVL
ncbi:MAG: hypothetical protein PHY54_13345 [Methylococcales bacterium]|nr:hypothetical protein [Methylococcales bacterium]